MDDCKSSQLICLSEWISYGSQPSIEFEQLLGRLSWEKQESSWSKKETQRVSPQSVSFDNFILQ
jgi:hypothetical protein